MPVTIQCTSCKTTLELDDGFRGGVCRCSTCGSLVQVPRDENEGMAKTRPSGPGGIPRPSKPGDSVSGSKVGDAGLSDPRSSSAGSSGLRYPRPVPTVKAATKMPKKRVEKKAPSRSSSPVSQGNAVPTADVGTPSRPAAHIKQIKKNNFMLGVGITLGILITLTVLYVVATYLLH